MKISATMPSDPLQTLQDREFTPAGSEEQLQKLVDLISRSQQGFRDLIDHLDQAVFTLSLEGEIRVANVCFAQILGTPFQDLIGHNLGEFLFEPAPIEAARALPDFLRAGVWSGRLPLRLRKTAEVRYFDCYFQAVEESGRVTAVSGWARDVTAQRESERRSTELFESLHEGILFSLPSGEILDANPALVRMLGYENKPELMSRNLKNVYASPAQREGIIAEIESKGSVKDQSIILLRKDGSSIHCIFSGLALRDPSGAVSRIQGMLRDVTDQREIEHELHREREFGRRLIACFPDMIALLDTDLRFSYVSESVRGLLGHPPSHFIGQRVGAHSKPEDRAKLTAMMDDLMSGRSARGQVEVQTKHANGQPRTFRVSAAPLFDEAGIITGIVTSGRDVTDSNLAERQSAEREKFASMGQMLAGAAHELNNPLTAILGVSDLLADRSPDDVTKRQAALVLKQARRAADIVQNLLAFSRPRAGDLLPLRIEDVVNQVLLTHRNAFQEKGIVIDFETGPALPPVSGDRKLLSQVFSNIVVNAEQAISASKQKGKLSVSISATADSVCASFANDGPAISPENIAQIFDPFFTTKRPGGGSGLGLTICLAIVKDHGGTIEVDSPPSGGAIFRVILPASGRIVMPHASAATDAKTADPKLIENQVTESPKSAIQESAGAASPESASRRDLRQPAAHESLKGHAVLVVDDEESIVEILHEGLSSRGMTVAIAGGGADALAHLENHPCEVVVCDFNMPGMKGNELFDRVRAQLGDRAPKFIFMTGELVESESLLQLRNQGALTLQKPFPLPALANLLIETLQPQKS